MTELIPEDIHSFATIFNTLEPIIALLSCGIVSVLFLPRLSISPIVGFLLSGILLGHHGLGIIPETHTIALLAELGVVFLLFDIGLHFSLRQVWHERKGIFIIGPLQVLLTGIVFFLIGQQLDFLQQSNVLISLALALSSTAVVSQVIQDKNIQGTPNSNTSLAILVFQDICAIFLLILGTAFRSTSTVSIGQEVILAFLKCIASFMATLLIGKYFLKPIFKVLIKHNNSDVFTMIALFLVLITGMTTAAIGLSLTFGAFLAGMIISETPFKHIIQTELRPFRFLLMSFFFVTVGASINYHVILTEWRLVLATTTGIIMVKFITIFLLFIALREKISVALKQSSMLFQGSEFLFVVIAMPAVSTSLTPTLSSALISSVAISMAFTSFIFDLSEKTCLKLITQESQLERTKKLKNKPELVIVGMNTIGQTVARAMESFNVPYLGVETDYNTFISSRNNGFPVVYGNKADIRFWENLGISEFKNLVLADVDMELIYIYEPIVNARFPHLVRYIPANDHKEMAKFQTMNLVPILSISSPPGLDIAEKILRDLGFPAESIAEWIDKEQKTFLESIEPSKELTTFTELSLT